MLAGRMVGLDAPPLPGMSDIELTVADIWATGISPEAYPTEFSRAALDAIGVVTARRAVRRSITAPGCWSPGW